MNRTASYTCSKCGELQGFSPELMQDFVTNRSMEVRVLSVLSTCCGEPVKVEPEMTDEEPAQNHEEKKAGRS